MLPRGSPEERTVADLAASLSKLHKRLSKESDEIKRAAVAASKVTRPRRLPQAGDFVWLRYSDLERARYLRKHGHGKPWRHRFRVVESKPHAVRLLLDGTVPEVMEWQSLRKCSMAAPNLHRPDLPVPDVDENHSLLMPEGGGSGGLPPDPEVLPTPPPEPEDEWTSWSRNKDKVYAIDSIVSATRVGSGWSLMVKWTGYPHPTPEPLSKILAQTNNPQILADIERCKQNYALMHPGAEPSSDRANAAAPDREPPVAVRVLPQRARAAPDRFIHHLHTSPFRNADRGVLVSSTRLLAVFARRQQWAEGQLSDYFVGPT